MPSLPTLPTQRLVLRPFSLAEAPLVQQLAGAREVASTTQNIPHPHPEGAAEARIRSHAPEFERGERLTLAITVDGNLIGRSDTTR